MIIIIYALILITAPDWHHWGVVIVGVAAYGG
jgi:hypothetical protein